MKRQNTAGRKRKYLRRQVKPHCLGFKDACVTTETEMTSNISVQAMRKLVTKQERKPDGSTAKKGYLFGSWLIALQATGTRGRCISRFKWFSYVVEKIQWSNEEVSESRKESAHSVNLAKMPEVPSTR